MTCFTATDDLSGDVEGVGNVDDLLCVFFRQINFQTMSHVEYLVHFFPIGAALFLDDFKEWRDREEVVLDNMEVVDEVENLGLRAA